MRLMRSVKQWTGCAAFMAILMACSGVGCAQTVLFHDAFMQEMGKWDALGCCWTVVGYENGKLLRQKSSDAKLINTKILISDRNFEDAVMETKIRYGRYQSTGISKETLDRLGAGIIFGYKDENNYYIYRLAGEDKVVLGRIINGTWEPLGQKNDGKPVMRPRIPLVNEIEDAPWITLKIDISHGGHKVVGYVNGNPQVEADVSDASVIVGKAGFTTFNAMADFAYMTIKGR